MSDLRQRRHSDTRRAIVDAALALFQEQGYETVTMSQVADAAGVSRRTLYRHFSTKDRIVVDLPVEWAEQWDAMVRELPATAPAREVLEQLVRAIAARLDEDAEMMRIVWRIVEEVPALEPGFLANRAWAPRIIALLTDRARGPDVAGSRAATIAGAYLGAIDVAMARWASGDDDRAVTQVVDEVLDHLRPLWPDTVTH